MEHITSRSNPLISRLRRLRDDRKTRRSEGIYLCDGVKLLEEAQKWGVEIDTLLLSEGVHPDTLPEGARIVTVPRDLMESVSPAQAPQGVLFLAKMPGLTPPEVLPRGCVLALDGLQDPGNVGTILRTADAFGCSGVVCIGHTSDPFSPKSVRSSMGAVFRIPVWEMEAEDLGALAARSGLPLMGAALAPNAVPVTSANLETCCLAVGNEGHGLSPALLEACETLVRIPMEPRCESLNAAAAAGILLWERYRRSLSGAFTPPVS